MKYTRRLSSPKISRRDFLKLTGITGGAAALAACGSQESPAEQAPETAPEEAPEEAPEMEKVALSFWTPGG